MLKQVISGGQTGADVAGLHAAKACGVLTGGWMPRGFLTLAGPRPEFAKLLRMQEHRSPNYPPRTRRNVEVADATLRFARHWSTPGERVTLKFLRHYGKPFHDIDVDSLPPTEQIVNWLRDQRVRILNIAGNTERTAPGIEALVTVYLTRVFRLLQQPEEDHTT